MSHFSGVAGPNGPIITVHIGLSAPRANAVKAAGQTVPQLQVAKLLIDTGASHTMIDDRFVPLLGLQATGTVPMLTPSTGAVPHVVPSYDVAMFIVGHANAVHSIGVQSVMTCPFQHQGMDGLLGRDIMSVARLTYSGPDNFFYLSF